MTQPLARLSLKSLSTLLDTIDTERLRFLHSIFMNRFMDFDHYDFRDEWMSDRYFDCFNEWFHCGSDVVPYELNEYVCEILQEWKNDSPSRYRKAMQSIKACLLHNMTCFESKHSNEVLGIFKYAESEADEKKVSKALFPFAGMVRQHIQNKEYIEAASLLFLLLDGIGEIKLRHDDWFGSMLESRTLSKIETYVDFIHDLYCHLRQLEDLPTGLALDMDVRLVSTNRHHELFGNLEFGCCLDTYSYDMICSAKDQYGYHSTIDDGWDDLFDY